MIEESPYTKEDLAKLEEAKVEFNRLVPEHLRSIFHNSIVRETPRGIRRYFPLNVTRKEGWDYLYEAFYILHGRQPKDNAEVNAALIGNSLDYYIEEFNGKLWVRTMVYC